MNTNVEIAAELEKLLIIASDMKIESNVAKMMFDGGEWLLVLLELESIAQTESRYADKCRETLSRVRELLGNPANPYET